MNKGTRKLIKGAIAFVLVLAGSSSPPSAALEGVAKPVAPFAGFDLRIDRITWLEDHMEHGGSIPMPDSMMPDMPPHGHHRLSVEITLYNSGQERQLFRVVELDLRSPEGHYWKPSITTAETITLMSGQRAHLFLQFDVPDIHGHGLHLVWQRGGTERPMLKVPPGPIMHRPNESSG